MKYTLWQNKRKEAFFLQKKTFEIQFLSDTSENRCSHILKLKAHQKTIFQAGSSVWRSTNVQEEAAAKVAVRSGKSCGSFHYDQAMQNAEECQC